MCLVVPYFVTTWYCPYFFNLNLIFTVSLYFSLPNFTSSCLQDAKFFKHSPIYIQYLHVGFPGGSVVKNCLPMQGHKFNSQVRKIPWRRKWQSTPVFLSGKSQEQRSLEVYSPWSCKRVGHDLATKQTNKQTKYWDKWKWWSIYFPMHAETSQSRNWSDTLSTASNLIFLVFNWLKDILYDNFCPYC